MHHLLVLYSASVISNLTCMVISHRQGCPDSDRDHRLTSTSGNKQMAMTSVQSKNGQLL